MVPQKTSVSLELQTLTCHRHEEGPNGARPYLWNIFFAIDGQGLKITPQFTLEGKGTFHFSEGSQSNLGPDRVTNGSIISIPGEVGSWKTKMEPFILPYFESPVRGVIGVLSVLLEENNLSKKGAEAGHQFLNEFVENSVNSTLLSFDPKRVDINDIEHSIKVYFSEKVSKFAEGLDKKLGKAVVKAQSVMQNLWSLIDKDQVIGYEMWHFSPDQFALSNTDTIKINHIWESPDLGKWELNGEFRKI